MALKRLTADEQAKLRTFPAAPDITADPSEPAILAVMQRARCTREEAIRILQTAAERSAPTANNFPGKPFA
jgi:hypothetical protein